MKQLKILAKNRTFVVIYSGHKNWVIGFLAQFIVKNLSNSRIVSFLQSKRHFKSYFRSIYFPRFRNVIFMHQSLAIEAFNKNKLCNSNINIIVRYTHESVDLTPYIDRLNTVKAITTENSASKFYLTRLGINANIISILPNPVDTKLFYPDDTNKLRDIIFVSNFYPRKNPNLIFDVIQMNPTYSFTILGKNWETWTQFQKLIQLENLIYSPFKYNSYPEILRQHRVFCSFSFIEGGPVPLLEALSCGLKVVTTDTGHARDIIKSPLPYNIIPVDSDAKKASSFLEMALNDNSKSCFDLSALSYENFIIKLKDLLM
jgi:glycosyltransferase involved in cell wall biosynthesis